MFQPFAVPVQMNMRDIEKCRSTNAVMLVAVYSAEYSASGVANWHPVMDSTAAYCAGLASMVTQRRFCAGIGVTPI